VSLPSIRSLTTTAEELAIGFFFSNLVTCLFGTCQDYLDYVPDLPNKNDAGEHLFASIRAVGLAGFSNVVHSPELIARAQLPDPTYEKFSRPWPNRPFDVQILPDHVQNPIYYFELFWGPEIWSVLIENTNAYAQYKEARNKKNGAQKSR
jgi:hypothetical protein